MERFDLPDGWEWKKFPDVAELNPPKSEIKNLSDNTEVTFVPMKSVDDVTGTIVTPAKRRLSEVRKGYTYFREGDVIFAKITPCMENGKSAIARNLANGIGFGSTEFHVIRPKQGLLAEWVFAIVRSQVFRDDAQVCMAGAAGQQRVPIDYLENTEIPIPPLEEQNRIVARIAELMKRVEEAKKLTRNTLTEFEAFTPALLAKAFKGEL